MTITWLLILALSVGIVGIMEGAKKAIEAKLILPGWSLFLIAGSLSFIATVLVFKNEGWASICLNFVVLWGFIEIGYISVLKLPQKIIDKIGDQNVN
jgi:hypothetical protein